MGKEILILKNITRENPGLLEDIIRENKIEFDLVDLDKGETIPLPGKFGAVVILGGPDSANDSSPKIKSELALVRQVLDLKIPYMGICLGLQILVKAAGGQVEKCQVKEVGFRDPDNNLFQVELTSEGIKDPLFANLDSTFPVFQLHGETVVLLKNMTILATGKFCRNQIVKVGPVAYGIQSHFELTSDLLDNWVAEDIDLNNYDSTKLKSDFSYLREKYSDTGRQLFLNFLRIAGFLK